MINIIRSDGNALVISSARALLQIPEGIVVDFGDDDMYIVKDMTLESLSQRTVSYYSNLITIPGEWRGWPSE